MLRTLSRAFTTVRRPVFIVPEQHTAVRQTWGRVTGVDGPGMNFQVPWMHATTIVSNRVVSETKQVSAYTMDSVPITVHTSVVSCVLPGEQSVEFAFRQANPYDTMHALLSDQIRKAAGDFELDALMVSNSSLANDAYERTVPFAAQFGIDLRKVAILRIDLPADVENSQNRRIIAARGRQAAADEAYIHARRTASTTEGVAMGREMITEAFCKSIEVLSARTGMTALQASDALLRVEKYNTYREMAKEGAFMMDVGERGAPAQAAAVAAKVVEGLKK